MGQDKALLRISGVPLLRRICDAALGCASIVYIVTPWQERYHSLVPPNCKFVPEPLPPDHALPPGPLVGFARGFSQVNTEWVLLLACDLPRLEPAVLQSWSQQLETVQPDTIALLPKMGDRWEPLCGFYRRSCRELLNHALATDQRSFQTFLQGKKVEEILLSNPNWVFNCNTPADWRKVEPQEHPGI